VFLVLGPDAFADVAEATRREWLETNGLGGYAMGTVGQLPTRKYHGYLTASLAPPTDRVNLVPHLEETLWVDGRPYRLSGAYVPDGLEAPELGVFRQFVPDPFPTWTFAVGDVTLVKRVAMVHGQNATVVSYRVIGGGERSVDLTVRPHVAGRDHHATLGPEHGGFSLHRHPVGDGLVLRVDLEALGRAVILFATRGTVDVHPERRMLRYPEEERRGEGGHVEACWVPGTWRVRLRDGDEVYLVLALGGEAADPVRAAVEAYGDPAKLVETEAERRARLADAAGFSHLLWRRLAVAADQFLVHRATTGTTSVIAGYPWFNDWGRDALIALPGLTLAVGRPDVAREILLTYARHVRDGLIPNMFADRGGEPLYNAVDAPLWFFEAAAKYWQHTGDGAFLREHLLDAMSRIVHGYLEGTRHGIRVDADGLVRAGEPGVQLTWMDAKVGDWVVTPRSGKPVEVQALWYNALRIMGAVSRACGQEDPFTPLAEKTKTSFVEAFWNEERGYLYDVVGDDGEKDPALRPNQIFAVSLTYPILPSDKQRRVVDAVWRHLLTPYGLRTLAPQDPQYRRTYGGDRWARDAAYHQGTVWPWLLGPFIRAFLRVYGDDPAKVALARSWLEGFAAHLADAGVGTVSEVFDGDAPHRPGGCIAQAWSVAELLRAWVEDVSPASATLSDNGF